MTNTSSEKDQDKFLKKRERFIHSFSSYPEVLTFVRYLCLTEFGDDNNSKLAEFCVQILHECLSHDKLEMVSAYVTIFRDLTRILSGNSPTSFDAISMKIVIEFVRQCDLAGQKCVLDDTFVDRLQHNITENWAAKLQELVPLFAKHYLQNGSLPAGLTVNQFQVAIAYLEYFAWPKPRDLALLQQKSDLIQSDAILKSAFHLKQYFPLISVSALRKILEIIVS